VSKGIVSAVSSPPVNSLYASVNTWMKASIPSPAACCKALSATSTIILFSIIFLLCTGKDKELKEKVRKESTKNNGTAIQQSHNLNPEIVKSNFTSLNLYVRSLNLYAGNPNLYSTKSIP
jgi:hypothetical protein